MASTPKAASSPSTPPPPPPKVDTNLVGKGIRTPTKGTEKRG